MLLTEARENLRPSLCPMLTVYNAPRSSLVAAFADTAETEDGLNPLTISHTARTSSCGSMGRLKAICAVEKGAMRPYMVNKADNMVIMAATTPQPDNHRGISFVR